MKKSAALACLLSATVAMSEGDATAQSGQTLGKQTLILGDSYTVSEGMGRHLWEELTKRGLSQRVTQYAICGSTPDHLLKGTYPAVNCGAAKRDSTNQLIKPPGRPHFPPMKSMVSSLKPDSFILAFGDNMMDYEMLSRRPAYQAYRRLEQARAALARDKKIPESTKTAKLARLTEELRDARRKLNDDQYFILHKRLRIEEVRRMLAVAKQSPNFNKDRCFWLTPTWGERNHKKPSPCPKGEKGCFKDDGLLAVLVDWIREATKDESGQSQCQLIDSRALLDPTKMAFVNLPGQPRDMMHPDLDKGTEWAEGILGRLQKRGRAESLRDQSAEGPGWLDESTRGD